MTTRLYYHALALRLRPFTAWLLCGAARNVRLIEDVLLALKEREFMRKERASSLYIPYEVAA